MKERSDVLPQEGAAAPSQPQLCRKMKGGVHRFLAAPVDFASASHYPNSQTVPDIFEGSLLATLRMDSGTNEEFYSCKVFP